MAKLRASERARLPDSAFAYIDSRGRRRLPINDEAHVRNALARFERVAFESDEARERARKRLLTAAKRYGIVPVGFITGQLQTERRRAAARPALPTGTLTLLLTDIERSTELLRHLGDGYAALLDDVRGIIRRAVLEAGGQEVDSRADEFFAVFRDPLGALAAAVAFQRELGTHTWPDDLQCRVRAGVHTGRPTLTESGYIGLSVHTAARVCFAAHGGQIVVSEKVRAAVKAGRPSGIGVKDLGAHRLPGLPGPVRLFQVRAEGLGEDFPPLRTGPSSG